MFEALGRIVTRRWLAVLLAWAVAWLCVWAVRPAWNTVTADGEFAFLPEDSPSLAAEELFRDRFGKDLLQSSIVVVVARPSRVEGLTGAADAPSEEPDDHDEHFLASVLLPELRETLVAGGFAPASLPFGDLPTDARRSKPKRRARLLNERAGPDRSDEEPPDAGEPSTADFPVAAVLTPQDRVVGPLFESRDRQAAIVVLGLRTEFGETRNAPLVTAVEELVEALRISGTVPAGLELAVSGTAVVGRDMREATERSGAATHLASLVLVIGLLLAIYRAPLLAAVPLITVVVGADLALGLLALAAGQGWFAPFMGLEVYVTVVAYGAGVDYCMFLTARYREELCAAPAGTLARNSRDDGPLHGANSAGTAGHAAGGWSNALAYALARVGPALAASAGTTVVGIGMMGFAEFAKFQQAAVGIVAGLVLVTAASLTLTPALLAMLGPVAFWPKIPHGRPAAEGGWLPAGPLSGGGGRTRRLRRLWTAWADSVCGSPGRWLLGTLTVMLPLAAVGWTGQDRLTYGLLSELPDDAPGVRGAAAVQNHFPPGETGPATVLLSAPVRTDGSSLDFRDRSGDGRRHVRELTARLWDRRDELGLASVRSLTAPLGAADDAPALAAGGGGGALAAIARRAATAVGIREYYIAGAGEHAGRTVRFDVIFQEDPFTRGSIGRLEALRVAVRESLPDDLEGADVAVLGATASLSDLAAVIARDRWRVNALVLLGVYVVLVLLLKRLALSAYLIVTVVLGYLTTLGFVTILFRLLAWWSGDVDGFAGLDWKVPTFLFTILVAVGEDYNIYLVTRVDEERSAARGPSVSEPQAAVRGVRVALARTGAIISGCGLIMAGTFGSLTFGELSGMVQLGVALTAGVLLDTFLIRPVLVPAYLTMLHAGRFGRCGRFLGAAGEQKEEDPADAPDTLPSNAAPVRYNPTPPRFARSSGPSPSASRAEVE